MKTTTMTTAYCETKKIKCKGEIIEDYKFTYDMTIIEPAVAVLYEPFKRIVTIWGSYGIELNINNTKVMVR